MKSLAFRIWLPFAILSTSMILIIAFYYSSKQEKIYIQNRRFELNELAKSVSLAVELSLDHENSEGLKKSLTLAKTTQDFENVSILTIDSKGNKKITYSYPENKELDVFKLDSNEFIIEKSIFHSKRQKGEIVLVASKTKIDAVIDEINFPLYRILFILFIISIILFYVFALWLVKPIKKLIEFSKALKNNQELEIIPNTNAATNEVTELENALISLSKSLAEERSRNDEILISLENQVSERTKENLQLSLVAKHALNGIIIADRNRKIVWANQSMLNISGYDLDELIGQSPKIFQFEGSNSETLNRIKSNLDNNQIVNEKVLNRGKNGREYWIELNIVPVFEGNEVTSYIAVETDITERILDDELLRKSEELNRRILENASEMIHTLDNQGNILWANKSWLSNIGVTQNEIKGKSITEFLDSNTLVEFGQVMPLLLAGQSVDNLDCVFISKTNNKLQLSGKTIPLFENGVVVGSQAYLHNVTQIVEAQQTIREKSKLQDLLMRISTKYINLPIELLDETILESLRDIANFVKADRAYIFNYFIEKGYCEYRYEWVAEGIESQINEYKKIPLASMPYWLDKHQNKEFVIVENADEVNEENIRQLLVSEGIKSLITIPIHDVDRLVGFVGFDLINSFRKFSEEEKEIFVLFSQMLVNVYKRLDYIRELNESKAKIEEVNTSLEQRVAENTKKNLDLSKSIIEQEKLATIGEISAGIAHDLNTPLGTIKVGADNVRFMINSLLGQNLNELTREDLNSIHKRIETVENEMFVGGLQLRKEKVELLKEITQKHPNYSPDMLDKMADLMVKARIKIDDEAFITRIFSTSNPLLFIEILYQVQMAAAQLETIKKSSDKAVKVVQDVRAFIKGDNSQNEKKQFNVRENISTVLGVFNYELRQNVDLKFEVDPHLEMIGYDVKLFQLWSNLIKNAFEAMDDQDEKYIGIFSHVDQNQLRLIFENNGPKIPEEVMENMFKKFYTTKAKKSGSGLGLSIVKNILSEHNASIEVFSDEQITKFIVTFVL